MMMSWKRATSFTVVSAADAAGSEWRAKLDAGDALTVAEVKGYAQAIGMSGESLPRGLHRLLADHGPCFS